MTKQSVQLQVNGERYDIMVKPNRTLLEVLREELSLTGAKEGCDSGECCSCTILLDGSPTLSCLTLAISAQGKEIITIEGLTPEQGELHPLQQAFVDSGAIQCGFCTPGLILTAKALLDQTPHPSTEEIKQGLSGNLCRCTGYVKIIEAVEKAAATGNP